MPSAKSSKNRSTGKLQLEAATKSLVLLVVRCTTTTYSHIAFIRCPDPDPFSTLKLKNGGLIFQTTQARTCTVVCDGPWTQQSVPWYVIFGFQRASKGLLKGLPIALLCSCQGAVQYSQQWVVGFGPLFTNHFCPKFPYFPCSVFAQFILLICSWVVFFSPIFGSLTFLMFLPFVTFPRYGNMSRFSCFPDFLGGKTNVGTMRKNSSLR